jgi:hypothetical protein
MRTTILTLVVGMLVAGCAGAGEAVGEAGARAVVGPDDTWNIACLPATSRVPGAARSSAIYRPGDGRECVGTLVAPATLVTSADCAAAPGAAPGVAAFGAVAVSCSWTPVAPTSAYAAAAEAPIGSTGLMAVTLSVDPSADGWPVATLGAPGADGEKLFALGHYYTPFGQSMGLAVDPSCSASWSADGGLSDCDWHDPQGAGGPAWGTAPLRVVGFYSGFDEAIGLNRVIPAEGVAAALASDPMLAPSAGGDSLILPGTDDRLDPSCFVASPNGEDAAADDGVGQFVLAGNEVRCTAWMTAQTPGKNYVAVHDACLPAGAVRGQDVGLFAIGRRATVCNGTAYDPVELYPVKLVARKPGRLAILNAGPALLIGGLLSASHVAPSLWFGADQIPAHHSTMVSVQDRPRPGDPGANTRTVSPVCWHNGRGFGSPLQASHNCDSAPHGGTNGGLEKGMTGLIFAVPNSTSCPPSNPNCGPVPPGYAWGYHAGPFGGSPPGGPGAQNIAFFLNDDATFLGPYL